MAQGRRERGKEEGKREGRSSFFCSLWGVDVSLRAERAAGAKKFFFLFFCGAAVAAAFLYWTRHGPPERRRREKKKKGEGKSTVHGRRRRPLEVGFFGGERRGAFERGSSALSPTPFSRECLVRVL